MKKRSVGYELIKSYVRFGFWLTHKKVIVTGRQHIPEGKPIIFAPNHQNALMDPLAVACTNRFQTVWLARADIFKTEMAKSILKYLKLLPVYRIRDGKDNLSNNEDVFTQVIQLLENRHTVALFPEAAHSGKRQMLPHRKAIPRIAFDAEIANNFQLDLQIVPVGIYYNHYWFFNRTLIVLYGEPISVDQYRDEYAENPNKALLSLRDEIHDRISPLTMDIDSINFYQQYENMRQLAGEAYSGNHFYNKNNYLQRFYAEQNLIKKLEKSENDRPEIFETLLKKTSDYFSSVSKANLTDEQIRIAGKSRFLNVLLRLLVALISLPLFAFGFIFNALPFYIPRIFLRRKVKDKAFLSTFNFAVGLLVFPVFYLVESILLYLFVCSAMVSILLFFLLPFVGKISYRLLLYYKETLNGLAVFVGRKHFRNSLKNLAKERDSIIGQILQAIGSN